MQDAAVVDGWTQGEDEAAIRVDRAVGQHITLGVTHLHAGAGFAATAQLAAGQAYHQVCGCQWCCVVATVNVWGGDGAGRRSVAGIIGSGNLQHLAVYLGGVEGDAEAAGGTDYRGAKHRGAVGRQHAYGAAGFGAAGEHAAVGADHQLAGGDRWGDVRCGDLGWQGGSTAAINGHHVQQFAIGLGGFEGDGEAAIVPCNPTAKQRAIGIMDLHAGAGRRGAADAAAVFGNHQVAGAGGRRRGRHCELQGLGGIATRVGLHQAQLRAGLHGRFEVDQEGTVSADHAAADHGAVGISHFNGGAGFTTPTQCQAVGADHDVVYGSRWRGVGCGECQRCRAVAGSIDQAHIQGFAIGLGR